MWIDYQYYDLTSSLTGELKKIDYSDTTADVTYEYFRHGGIKKVIDATGTRDFTYRTSDLQLDKELLATNYYGSRTNRKTITRLYQSGAGVTGRYYGLELKNSAATPVTYMQATFGFDGATGRVSSASAHGATFTYAYKANSNLISTVTSGNYQRILGWQSWRDLSDYHETKWGSTSKARYIYDTNWFGQFSRERLDGELAGSLGFNYATGTAGGRYVHFQYNLRGELEYSDTFLRNTDGTTGAAIHERFEEYTYDNAQSRKTHELGSAALFTYGVNSLNQYTTYADTSMGIAPEYDDDGNLGKDPMWVYKYDAENRLRRVQHIWGSGLIDYTYDYMGRRVSEIGSKVVAGLTQQRYSGDWTGYLGQEVVAKANATSGWTDGTRRWSGYFEVPSDGLYTFTGTGTNALLKIEVDGKGIGTAWVAGPTGTAERVNVQFIVSTEAKVWWAVAWLGRTTGGARETDREMIELRPLIIEESRSLTR